MVSQRASWRGSADLYAGGMATQCSGDLYSTIESDRAAGRWVAASEQLEAWIKEQQLHHAARLQGTERALYVDVLQRSVRTSAPDYATYGIARISGSGGSGHRSSTSSNFLRHRSSSSSTSSISSTSTSNRRSGNSGGGGGGGGAAPTKPGFFKAILTCARSSARSSSSAHSSTRSSSSSSAIRSRRATEPSKSLKDGAPLRLAGPPPPPAPPPALPPALAEVVPRVREVIEAAFPAANLLHACAVSHHLLGTRGLTHTARLLVVSTEALYLVELERRGTKLLRRVPLGAIAQLFVDEARTQLGVAVLDESDMLLTIRELGVDLDRTPLGEAAVVSRAFPGCSNPLLTGVVDALQRGHQVYTSRGGGLYIYALEATLSFFRPSLRSFNPRASSRRQPASIKHVDSTRFGPHLAVRTHSDTAGDLSQLLQLGAATKKAANLRLSNRRRKSSQSRDSDSDEDDNLVVPDEAANPSGPAAAATPRHTRTAATPQYTRAMPVKADKPAFLRDSMGRTQFRLHAEL